MDVQTAKTGETVVERGELVHGGAWRRVTVRGVEAYELASDPGACACCGEAWAGHGDDELRGCAADCAVRADLCTDPEPPR